MRHVDIWFAEAGHAEGNLFCAIGKAESVGGPLDAGSVARVFRAMAKLTEISPELVVTIRAHSSRVSAAQGQVRYGTELSAVMQAG